jgi:predicted DNA-binding protein
MDMEVDMELTQRKTTILLTATLHQRLVSLARRRGVSMGHLIRKAVEAQYGFIDPEERMEAVRALGELALPVDSPTVMKAESDPFGHGPIP